MKIVHNNIAVLEGDLISSWVELSGRLDHDRSALPIIERYIDTNKNVIDIGAFIGDHTIAYSKKTSQKVYAFEPNKKAFECLMHNSQHHSNIECYHVALGNYNGRVSMNIDKHNIGANYVTYNEAGEVSIVKLDEYNFKNVGLIKIDAEGYEVDILKGAKQTILNSKPILIIEVNRGALRRAGTSEYHLYEILKEYGYICENIYKDHPLDGEQYDIVCKIN